MDFLVQFRLVGPPKLTKPIKLIGAEAGWRQDIYTWFVLLSNKAPWTFLQYWGILSRFLITTYICSFNPDIEFGVLDILNYGLDALYFVDVLSTILLWLSWHANQGNLTERSTALSRLLWRNKEFKPRNIVFIIIDALSLLPLQIITHAMKTPPEIFQLNHTNCIITPAETGLEFSLFTNVVKILWKFFVVAIVLSHSLTCLWYLLQDEEDGTSLYMAKKEIVFNSNKAFEWYMVALYYVLTTFTNVGFGDILPRTDYERILALIIAMVGFALINGYLIGALSSVLLEQARRLTNLRLRLRLIESELEERKVPADINRKIMRFYYDLWITRKGAGSTNPMLDELPPSMTSEVYFDVFSSALEASLLFRACDEYSQRAISRVMEINLYMAGDVILKRSEMNSKMFFIRKGTIQIMSYQDDETEIMTFGAGTVFGQCALLLSLPAKSEVHAATFCEIHSLSRRNLFYTLIDYPEAKEVVINVHKNLILNVLADKYNEKGETPEPGNILNSSSFYKRPLEASKIGRDDVCLVTTFPYIFMPDTIFLRAWDIMQVVVITIIIFYYPYCAAFLRRYPVDVESLIVIADIIYILDIYLTFFTAVNKENILLSTWRQIAMERLRQAGIYLDIISTLPLHYLLPHESRQKPVILCLRCIKLYKIPLLFGRAEYNLTWPIISFLRIVKYIMYFLIGCYAVGVLYYMQACYFEECNPTSWYDRPSVAKWINSPVFVCLYFAVMVISATGLGDFTVGNVIDIAWVLNFYFPAVLLLCYIISEYSAHLSLSGEPRFNFIELAGRINAFLTTNKMLPSERIRVRQYLNLQWEKNMGYEFIYGHELFYDTPPHLYSEINLQSRCKGLQDMILFKGLGDNIISTILKSSFRRTLPPHEVVIYAGEMCSTLLIVEDGYCEVTYGRDVSVKRIVGPGANISTVELFLGMTAMCHVRTLTHCVIVKVKKSDIRRALILNPVAARELELAIHEFKQNPLAQVLSKSRPIRLHLSVRTSEQQSVFRFRYYQKESGNKELREPYMKLGICQCIRFILRSTTVLPYGKLLKKWELSRCVFAFFSAILFPPLPYLELEHPFLYYLGWFLDMSAWIDLYFRIHVGYYNNRKILVTHPLWTCGHYVKGSFALDFICCFPFDRILYRKVYDSQGETRASELSIDVLRILRVGQIHRIPATLTRLGQDFLSTPSVVLVTVMHTGFIIVYVTFFTSIWVLYTTNFMVKEDGSYRMIFYDPALANHIMNHLELYGLQEQPTQLYMLNVYWLGLTSFSIGFGDFSAPTHELMTYIILVIVISYLYFSYVTIAIASHFSTINLNLTLYQKRLNHLIKFLKSENIEPLLKQHIINHFEFIWKKSRGMETDVVFANFNLALKDDVMLHLYEETLRGVTAFAHLDPSFFRILSSRLKEAYFQTGASVFKQGDIISNIYIIHQGEVTLVGDLEEQTAILWRSMMFGHLDFDEKSISQVSAVATKNVQILMIPTNELYQLLDSVHAKIHQTKEMSGNIQNQTMLLSTFEDNIPDADDRNLRDVVETRRAWFIHKSYKFSEIIHIINLIAAFLSVNLVTYHLAFQSYHYVILGISIPIELLYVMKIYMGFNTGYIDDSGEFVSDLKVIRKRYMRLTGFYKDFFTIIPFEIFSLIDKPGSRLYTATCLRMTKLLRIYEIWFFFNSKADTLNVNMVLLKLVSMSMATAIMYHQCACFWYMVFCPRADCPESETYKKLDKAKCNCNYLCCLYFVNLILTATGFGDLTPSTAPEMMYVLALSYVARIYAATFIGQMVSTVQKSLYARTNYTFRTETLKGFLSANNVSTAVRRTVLNYANDLWRNEKGYQVPELLMNAPKYIISEIKLSAYGSHINDNPLFQKCDPLFRKHLINELKRTVYYAGNIIVHEGEVNGTAYFIHYGQVGFRTYNNIQGSRIYVVEKFFGLAQGIRRRLPHYHTCFARSICVILTLTLDDWEYLIDYFPKDIIILYREVEKLKKIQEKRNLKT